VEERARLALASWVVVAESGCADGSGFGDQAEQDPGKGVPAWSSRLPVVRRKPRADRAGYVSVGLVGKN